METRRNVKFTLKSSGPAALASALKARRSQFRCLKIQIPGISRNCDGGKKTAVSRKQQLELATVLARLKLALH